MSDYPWKRFWRPRGGEMLLTEREYLADPDLGGSYSYPHLVPFETIAEDPCLVLLGEPGIGKSTALATHVQEIQQRRSPAMRCLHVDLRAYGSEQRLQRALFDHPEIISWQGDTSVLHLFLDSLDESLLRIDTVTDMLVEELERWPCHRLFLRIACRTAAWRPTFEEQLRHRWGQNAVGVFELQPLSLIDVVVAAQAEVRDPEVFLREVYRVAAVPFALNPVTLTLLLNIYRHQGTLPPTQREVYERGCRLLCEETNPRRQEAGLTGNFTPEQRLCAAERLAAMTLFANRYAIWTGTDWGDVPEADITLHACTDEEAREEHFTEPALKEAVSTGLFTGRGLQELGWAHQTFAEFLAARFVTRTLSVEQMLSLIQHPDDLQGKLIPQLYETAAWMACMESEVFRAIMRVEPDVLLRSDVSIDDARDRANLIDALLQYYEVEGALDDDRRNVARYDKLAHPGLATQLEPYLLEKTRRHVTRRVAIDIAEVCHVRDLVDALLRVALDGTDEHFIRVCATAAIDRIESGAAIAQLKPLLTDDNDPDDELKGIALRALWPRYLTADELFAILTVPQDLHLIGMYEGFLLSSERVVEHLHAADLPAALTWAQQQALVQHYTINSLVDGILMLAWQYLETPEIAQTFAQVVRQRFERHDAMIGNGILHSSARIGQGNLHAFMQHLREDANRRRLLLEALLPLWQESSPALNALVFSQTPIVYEEDMPWLLTRLRQETDEPTQRKLVQLISQLFRMGIPAHVEAVCEASRSQPLLAHAFGWLLEPVFIHSPQAQELKRAYYAQQERHEPLPNPDPLDPAPAVMAQQLLEKYDSGNLDAWWQLNRILTIEPESTRYGNEFAADLTTLPGWQQADEPTRTRLIKAAHSYILARAAEAQCALQARMHTWMGKSLTIDFPLYAGYRAFLLLLREAPKLLESIPPAAWRQWAPMFASYPLLKDDTAMEDHHRLIRMAYQHASVEIIATSLAQIDQQNREMHSLNCLHLVEACWDSQLEEALLSKAGESTLDPICVRDVLTVVLTHDPAAASTIVETLLQQAYTSGDYEHTTIVAGALIAHTPDASWEYVWPLLAHDDAFGRALLLGLQRAEAFEHALAHRLTPGQIADLFLRAVELFPPVEDPPGPDGFVSDRQLLSIWRSQLITFLQHKGTNEGCAALRAIALAHPEMEWIRRVLVDAERLVRRRTWSGFRPQEILAIARDKARRLVENGEQLLAVIAESLVRLEETLHGETPARIFLWDIIPPAQGGRENRYRPKDENSLSNYVKLHLERDLKQRGIIVLREVEIRHAASGDPGERIDLYVDAFVPGPDHTRIDILTVIIEVKGCWHREVTTAMQTQLVERYLRENPGRLGFYLVGWFNCPQWDANDHRKEDAPHISLQEARVRFAQQAEELTARSEGRHLVRSFVLDTALR